MTALALLLLALQGEPTGQVEPAGKPADLGKLLEEELLAQDDAVDVKLVSNAGELELVDVVANGAPAHEVLARLAKATHRELKLEAGETALHAAAPLDAHLERRPLREALEWLTGAVGLAVELSRNTIRVRADGSNSVAPEELLQRAIDGWRAALLRDPLQPDAPRLRFQIGNALFQLGDFKQAIDVWKVLEDSAKGWNRRDANAPEFGDLPLVYFRAGHAYAALGDESGAQAQWLSIATLFPTDRLVAPARLETVRSFRRQGDATNANLVLRLVVEAMRTGLSARDLVTAGELLNEGGSHERAEQALQWALQSTSDAELEERGLVALARSQAGRRDWHGVVATAESYVRKHVEGKRAAEIWLLLGQAHHELADPFTALLAIRRARELQPTEELSLACDLLEGQLFAESGLIARAEAPLARAGASNVAAIAAPALTAHAHLLRDDGQLEAAARLYDRLAQLEGSEIAAAIALAEVYLLQRNRTRCLDQIRDALHRTQPPLVDGTQRTALLEIARLALRDAPSDVAWRDLLAPEEPPMTATEGTQGTQGKEADHDR